MTSCGSDRASIEVRGSEIECVDEFVYLGSLIVVNGRLDAEVDRRVANTSKAFGALHRAVFGDTLAVKRKLYNSCVLSILLYGSECWTLLRRHLKRFNLNPLDSPPCALCKTLSP